jgi:hypothetical protein
MKTFWVLLVAILSTASVRDLRAQERKEEETREIRVYLIDRIAPERVFKDAVAVLTLERPSGRGRTFLLPRVDMVATPGEKPSGPGILRGLAGTPYFVELNVGDSAPPAAEKEKEEEPKGTEMSSGEILRRVHHGAYFAKKIPASLVSEPFTATVTMRLGDLTFTSEEFQGPRTGKDVPEEIAARVDRSLDALTDRARRAAGFMDLRPAVVELTRELSKLAPQGFEDSTGAFELNRQWCLAHARAIERACYDGNLERIVELSQRCGPRLNEMTSYLTRSKDKQKEPVKEPEPPTEVPVK